MRPTTSASNLFRRALCPGSARMEEGLPEEDSEQSREGQLLHDYAAHPEYERSFLNPEQRDLLERNGELLKAIESKLDCGPELGRMRELTGQSDIGISGTPDLVVRFATALWINDTKFGFRIVERAEINLQLRAYAVIAAEKLKGVERVFVSITQPRLAYSEGISLAEYTPDDIEDSRKQIAGILEQSAKPEAPLVAGEVQCRYCKAKLICPAFQSAMVVPISNVTPNRALSKTAQIAYLEQELAKIEDEQLESVLTAITFADFVKDIARDEARKRIADGKLNNFVVAKDSEVREISDVRRAMALLSLAGLPKDDIYDCVSKFAIGTLGEKLRESHPTWTAKDANEWIDKKLASVIERETRRGRIFRK